MKHPLFLLLTLALAFAARADKGPSIMYGDPAPEYSAKKTNTAADKHAELCKKLKRQMKDLEGNPLLRNPVVIRYQAECVQMHN